MDIKKLLFVTKFEKLRFDALQSLLPLQKAALSHVVLLNVIERDDVAMHRGGGYDKDEEIKLREKANIRFIDWAETLFEKGMEVGVYIVVGSFVKQVINSVEKEEVDLIIIGPPSKGKINIEQFIKGSDLTEILHRSDTPVLVYKYLSDNPVIEDKPFDRPMLATNWSSSNRRAIDYLKELKNVIKELHVVHVADEKSLAGSSARAIQKIRKDSRVKLEKICTIFEAEGIKTKDHVYIGETFTEIEKAARECQATMIVTGSSSRRSWKEMLLGSITKELAEKSSFPLLIVPPGKSKTEKIKEYFRHKK